MAVILTVETCTARLQAYLDAEEAILVRGQSYMIETDGSRRSLTRADLPEIQKGVELWTRRLAMANNAANGVSRTRNIVN